MSKKNFIVNCASCDTTKMNEEDFANYEQIMINAGMVVLNKRSKSILNKLGAQINSGSIVELPEGKEANIKAVNGKYEIKPGEPIEENCILMVNGKVVIHPNTESVLSKIDYFAVNGKITCPESLMACIKKIKINGKVSYYPDDSIVIDSNFNMDKYFPMRVVQDGLYWAEEQIIITDEDIDISKLTSKNVRFSTKKLIVNEKFADDLIPLFNIEAKIEIVPIGFYAYTGKTVIKNENIKKNGGKIIIFGEASFDEKFTAFNFIEKLIVKGKLSIFEYQVEKFEKIDAEYENLNMLTNARRITEVLKAKIDKALLEKSVDGVEVSEAAMVIIEEDVEPELILERLKLKECAMVKCSKKQESAVAAVSEEVATIKVSGSEDDDSWGPKKLLKLALTTKIVNTSDYVL